MHTSNVTSDLNEPLVDRVVSPVWADPDDILSDAAMTVAEKRALLASWASDARAVPNYPALRRLESGAFVTIDAVLYALKQLDKLERPKSPEPSKEWPRKGHWSRMGQRWRKYSRDDDDDDPFSPAPAIRPPRLPVLDGAAAA